MSDNSTPVFLSIKLIVENFLPLIHNSVFPALTKLSNFLSDGA